MDLKKRREHLGLSLNDVAKQCGVVKSCVHNWENGHQNGITSENVIKYAKALRVPVMAIINPDYDENTAPDDSGTALDTAFAEMISQLSPEQKELIYLQIQGILNNRK